MKLISAFSNNLKSAIDDHPPSASKRKISVAISGGSDSFALLDLAHIFSLENNYQLLALTIDHGLRKESSDEAEAIHQWCLRRNILHIILRDEAFINNPPKTRIQERARQMRYDLLAKKCHEENCQILLIGQHLDDQIETIVMRHQKSSALYGLAGMPLLSYNLGLAIIRPLLKTPKSTLIDYCQQNELPFIEDPSNRNTHFERVRIRQALANGKINKDQILAIQKKAIPYREEIDRRIEDFFQNHITIFPERALFIDQKHFTKDNHDFIMRALFKAIELIRDKYIFYKIQRKKNLLNKIISLIQDKNFAKKIVFGGVEFCFVTYKNKTGLFFYREPSACTNQIYKTTNITAIGSLISKKYLRSLDIKCPDYYFFGNFLKTFPVIKMQDAQRYIPFLSLQQKQKEFIFTDKIPIKIAFQPNMLILKTRFRLD